MFELSNFTSGNVHYWREFRKKGFPTWKSCITAWQKEVKDFTMEQTLWRKLDITHRYEIILLRLGLRVLGALSKMNFGAL